MLKLSPDEAALLKAVCADRDNDLPRLVYADWLDEHGRPERAEFIRLQCVQATEQEPAGLSRRQLQSWYANRPMRWATVQRLADAHSLTWERELPKWAGEFSIDNNWYGGFVRGFREEFAVAASAFVRYGPQLLDRTPVRQLRLAHARACWDDIVRCSWLREVLHLDLGGESLSESNIAALTGTVWLCGVRRLALDSSGLRDPAARSLAGCRHLSGLTELSLGWNNLTLVGLETLLASPYLTGCRFHLRGNPRFDADPHTIRRLLGPRGTL